jgi:hypothetical protein
MREITKAQLTIGLLAYFATVWDIIINPAHQGIIFILGYVVLELALFLILAYVLIALLEWVKVFDLKTNSILTLLVLVTLNLISVLKIS